MSTENDIVGVGGNAGARLKAIVERIERTEAEIETWKEDQKEIYSEAKGCGFDTKIIRKIIKRRKMDKDKLSEEELLIQTYEAALSSLNSMME